MDRSPKRRKYKDNPYCLEKDSLKNKFYVSYKTEKGFVKIEVTFEIFSAFDSFEKKDLRELNQFDRHIEHHEVDDNLLYKRNMNKDQSIEKFVEEKIQYELLYNALHCIPTIQKRRIILYYFYEMTLKKIAEKEGCSIMSVKGSIDAGIKNLKKFM